MEIEEFIKRQMMFSQNTFGVGRRTIGITEHIKEEIEEVLKDPGSPDEWIDIAILAFDGAWRSFSGTSSPDLPGMVEEVLINKQRRNIYDRIWPRNISEDKPVNHEET